MHLIINYKNYPQATGDNVLALTRKIAEIDVQTDHEIIVCPQATDIRRIRENFPNLEVWAQHVDPITTGRHTGWLSAASIKAAGATGVLINHSEHKLTNEQIAQNLKLARANNLKTMVLFSEIDSGREYAELDADYLAFEPAELVGGDESLTDVAPQRAQDCVRALANHEEKLFLGAGVRDRQDVEKASKLGYYGVLVASGVVKAEEPGAKVRELLGI